MADDLLQNVVDILENAQFQKGQLSELLASIKEAQDQVHNSAEQSRNELNDHFRKLKIAVDEMLDSRLSCLINQINNIEKAASVPLDQCHEMLKQGFDSASRVIVEGSKILSGDPATKLDQMIKLKDSSDTKALNSVPAVPSLNDVPCISVDLYGDLEKHLLELITQEGKVFEQAPVQIIETLERPGGILVKWMECDDELDVSDFCLEYCYGNHKKNKAPFQNTAYTGPATSYTVRNLSKDVLYSFRVSCRSNNNSSWNIWSVPVVASTSLTHYKWSEDTDAYSLSLEKQVCTRVQQGLTHVLYSDAASFTSGNPISFTVLEKGESSPFDSIGISLDSNNSETLHREGTVLVTSSGSVFLDGQEMKIRLPEFRKGSVLVFETEVVAAGKVRVQVELEEKVVTVDLKVPEMQDAQHRSLYFGMRFSHENWSIKVE